MDNPEVPTKVANKNWLYIKRNRKVPIPETEKESQHVIPIVGGGKWLIFLNKKYVDEFWLKIKSATEKGKLGTSAKVCTSISVSRSYLICVYTRDAENIEDNRRVRNELRKIGIKDKIPYKSNDDTERGIYSDNTDGPISPLFE